MQKIEILKSNYYQFIFNNTHIRIIILIILTALFTFNIGCGGRFSRLSNIKDQNDSPQPLLEKQYHKSDFWGGSNGIYISVDKKASKFGGQNYASVKIMNQSGVNLNLDVKNDHYWFKRFGTKYSLYRRPGSRYPPKISNTRDLEFDLVGIETFANVDSISFIFVEMDSLIITTIEK